ncbi:hypothetical protein ACMFMG_006818 [Clarireedia jacksonii]
MPMELLVLIFDYLSQLDLRNLMLTSSNLLESAATFLYRCPYFASTYRYAQFAYTISKNQSYAAMVRVLDLSYFTKDLDEHGQLLPQAGWREFTYRDQYMPYIQDRDRMGSSGAVRASHNASTHPAPIPQLKNFHRTRDLPAGAICHVLSACKNLRKINISRLQLTIDYYVPDPNPPNRFIPIVYRPKPTTTYISDIPTSRIPPYSNRILRTRSLRSASPSPSSSSSYDGPSPRSAPSTGLTPPHSNSYHYSSSPPQAHFAPVTVTDIIAFLKRLKYLEEIKAKDFLWLSEEKVKMLLEGCRELKWVDFRGCGLNRDSKWAVRGSREEVLKIVG